MLLVKGPHVGRRLKCSDYCTLDVELASLSTRVASASRITGLRLASESNLEWAFPDLRVECVLVGGFGLCSAIPVA
eukprot:5801390-Alexandrium_andersonii.AAC.1